MQCLSVIAAMAALVSCESTKTLMPATRAPEDFGLAVRFQAATESDPVPQLMLVESSSGAVLARANSFFTPDVVKALGAPAGNRLFVLASLSGDTIAARENASDASPDEQMVVFKRDHHPDGSASWYARNYFPPSRPALPYARYGSPATVDDEFLYYTIDEGPSEKVKWTALETVPPGYKPKPVEVKEDEPKNEKGEKSEEAKIEQTPT